MLVPGTYTVRMEDNGKTYETKISVGLDQRVTWTLADRQAQFDAADEGLHALQRRDGSSSGRSRGCAQQVAAAGKSHCPATMRSASASPSFDLQLDKIRKEIVATTEGGAITGEERLREHTDQLYGALNQWEGPPSAYQLDNIAGLRSQLSEIIAEFSQVTGKELPQLNALLKAKGAQPLAVPAPTAFDADDGPHGSGRAPGGRFDPDSVTGHDMPADLRLWN